MATTIADRVAEAFQDAQTGVRTHGRGGKAVAGALAAQRDVAVEAVLDAVDRILAAPRLAAAVDRSVTFLVSVVTANSAALLLPTLQVIARGRAGMRGGGGDEGDG
jgi:hypothetical protein